MPFSFRDSRAKLKKGAQKLGGVDKQALNALKKKVAEIVKLAAALKKRKRVELAEGSLKVVRKAAVSFAKGGTDPTDYVGAIVEIAKVAKKAAQSGKGRTADKLDIQGELETLADEVQELLDGWEELREELDPPEIEKVDKVVEACMRKLGDALQVSEEWTAKKEDHGTLPLLDGASTSDGQ